jgi:L-lactate dehydrogenase
MSELYESTSLMDFTAALFRSAGLEEERAMVTARGFVEAELLGFPSHGLTKVPDNLRWLMGGETDATGDPEVLVELPAIANWDAHRLPGHWIMYLAAAHAISRTRQTGTFTMTLRRCQHVACLAAALIPVVEAELIALVMVSSPEEAFVSPFGGSARLFSNNPVAFTAPTSSGPILFDVSMAITSGGQVDRAERGGLRLPEPSIKTADGTVTDDPREFRKGGSVMPIGGMGHGHKGHALTIMTEVLSQALGGFGRAESRGESEQNSVFLHVLDPAAFGSRADYDVEVDHLVAMIDRSPPDGTDSIRVPGIRTWQERARRLAHGISLDPGIMDALAPLADELGVEPPLEMRETKVRET